MSVTHKSADEVEAEHLQVLDPQLGPLYHALHQEVGWLHAKWKQFRHLYGSSESVDLLNEVAGFFFLVVQDVMWEDVILHVARLTDPPGSGSKENLTLRRLAPAIPDADLAARVEALVKTAISESSFARDWRNRHLAHRDLQLALDPAATPLPPISREHMEQALSALRSVLNEVKRHYWNSTTAFEHFLAHTDAEALTHCLSEAVKAERRRRERWEKGQLLAEDIENNGAV